MLLSQEHSKSQQVIDQLEADILSGHLVPGSRLQSVRSLADHFGTCISVINNAFNELETRCLIERQPRRGVFVRDDKIPMPTLRQNVFLCMPADGHVYQDLFKSICDQLFRNGLIPMFVDYRQLLVDKPNSALQHGVDLIFASKPHSAIIFGRNYWQNPILSRYPDLHGVFVFEMDYPGAIPGNAVLVDYDAASYAMTSHLARNGRKRILFCLADPDPSQHPIPTRSLHHFSHLCSGYERALRDHGIAGYNCLYTRAWGETVNAEVLSEIMASPERPDAIMCHMDRSAFRFIEAAGSLGIKVPDDLAITGFFNTPWAEISKVKITSINFDLVSLSQQVATMVMEKKQKQQVVFIQPELIIRESSGGKK